MDGGSASCWVSGGRSFPGGCWSAGVGPRYGTKSFDESCCRVCLCEADLVMRSFSGREKRRKRAASLFSVGPSSLYAPMAQYTLCCHRTQSRLSSQRRVGRVLDSSCVRVGAARCGCVGASSGWLRGAAALRGGLAASCSLRAGPEARGGFCSQ